MGTSKGYIPPTNQKWRNAKRAVGLIGKSGYSYSKVKKKLQCINEKIGKDRYTEDALKVYLDILVSEDILFPEIASLIYKKHKEAL